MGYGVDENQAAKSLEEQFDWQLDHSVSPPRWVGGIAGLNTSGAYVAITSTTIGSDEALDVNSVYGFSIPIYDYLALTYVAAGNGTGEVETVVYKDGGAGGSTVATLTIAYNSDDEISSVTKT